MLHVPHFSYRFCASTGSPDGAQRTFEHEILLAGVTAGQLQKLQAETAQLAALTAQMAHSAGWANLNVLLLDLAASAQAGSSKDLFNLMQARLSLTSGLFSVCSRFDKERGGSGLRST